MLQQKISHPISNSPWILNSQIIYIKNAMDKFSLIKSKLQSQ